MQGLNHVVFGSLVALVVKEPAIAIPVALGSHFVMDAIPHYGEDHKAPRGSRRYHLKILIDASLSILFVASVLAFHPAHSWLIITCAIFAVLPDLMWPLALKVKHQGPLWAFFKFHKLIQTESRSGIYIELAWLAVTGSAVYALVR